MTIQQALTVRCPLCGQTIVPIPGETIIQDASGAYLMVCRRCEPKKGASNGTPAPHV